MMYEAGNLSFNIKGRNAAFDHLPKMPGYLKYAENS